MNKCFNHFSALSALVLFTVWFPLEMRAENRDVLCESFNGGTALCTFIENDKETICEAIGNGLGQCNSEDGETKLNCISLSGDFGATGLQLSCKRENSTGFVNAFD